MCYQKGCCHVSNRVGQALPATADKGEWPIRYASTLLTPCVEDLAWAAYSVFIRYRSPAPHELRRLSAERSSRSGHSVCPSVPGPRPEADGVPQSVGRAGTRLGAAVLQIDPCSLDWSLADGQIAVLRTGGECHVSLDLVVRRPRGCDRLRGRMGNVAGAPGVARLPGIKPSDSRASRSSFDRMTASCNEGSTSRRRVSDRCPPPTGAHWPHEYP